MAPDSHNTYNSTWPFHSSNKRVSTKLSRVCRLHLPSNRQGNNRCAHFYPTLIEILRASQTVEDPGWWSGESSSHPNFNARQQKHNDYASSRRAQIMNSLISSAISSSNFITSSCYFLISFSVIVSSLSLCLTFLWSSARFARLCLHRFLTTKGAEMALQGTLFINTGLVCKWLLPLKVVSQEELFLL